MTQKRLSVNAAASALGRRGGKANTKAQNAARKANAQKAGRPKRVCKHCGQPVLGGHVDRSLDTSCGAHGWRWERAGQHHPMPENKDAVALDVIAASFPVIDAEVFVEWLAEQLRATGREVKSK